MTTKFNLKKTANGQYMFNLVATNGEIILTREMYKSKAGAKNGIRSVKENAQKPERYKKLTAMNGEPYFVLCAGNHKVVGRSETYFSTFAMRYGIQSVMNNAGSAEVVELT